ncbi:MAG: CoA protein activase [Eubacteriales bacterium]|nr:CoA protein activase [Eubacteriales bacterium]
MKVTFPHMGNTYICVKSLLDDLNVDYVIPPFNGRAALDLGKLCAPEFACLPLKITIGTLIKAYEMGADTILMTGGRGPCRFGYYCEMQREILNDAGYKMDAITLEMPKGGIREFIENTKRLVGKTSVWRILNAVRNAVVIAESVDKLEKLSYKTRPREMEKGATDLIYRSFKEKALSVKGSRAMKELISKTAEELNAIPLSVREPLKIGIVGEIFTTIDSDTGFHMDKILGDMGFEVDRQVTVSEWIIEHMLKKVIPAKRDLRYVDAAKPYLKTMIGGHAQETIGNAVLYAKAGYDGIIQTYPLTCMPEIVAQSILPMVEKDHGIPVLSLIIDEMTGEAGYMTRLEAFADLLVMRRKNCEMKKVAFQQATEV